MSKDKNESLSSDQDLNKYRDPNGLTVNGMNFGLWLSEEKQLIKKIGFFFLLAVAAFFVVYRRSVAERGNTAGSL